MNEEVVKQVLESARKIFAKNRALMDKHCRIIRVSLNDLEILNTDKPNFPSLSIPAIIPILARAVVTMEMVFEMNHELSKAKECSSLAKYLASKGK
ncbi:hypothetical protein ES705_44533 [subsurface metagenome]